MAATTMEAKISGAGLAIGVDIEFVDFGKLAGTYTPGQMIVKTLGTVSDCEFILQAFPNGVSEDDVGALTVVISLRRPVGFSSFHGKCVAELLPLDWQPSPGNVRKISLMQFMVNGVSHYDGAFGKLEDIRRGGFLPDETLRMRVRVDPLSLPGLRAIDLQTPDLTASDVLAKDLGWLLSDSSTSDMKLIADGKEFEAHWSILASRSLVFRAMLDAKMSEAERSQVEVPDMDAISMSRLLHFIYTGTVDGSAELQVSPVRRWTYEVSPCVFASYEIRMTLDQELVFAEKANQGGLKEQSPENWHATLDNGDSVELSLKNGRMEGRYFNHGNNGVNFTVAHAAEVEVQIQESWGRLLHAADKYCISGLAALCEQAMEERLLVCNAATVLQIASNLGRDSLKKTTLNYITMSEDQTRAVRDTKAFDSLDRELLAEVYEVLMDSRTSRKRKRTLARGETAFEFPADTDWSSLSNSQLRRACIERELPTGGSSASLVALLKAQGSSLGTPL
eukprot:TRINITY_DN77421_c0_g1_i1.p1 TRINITY_DN77421_c0_g1~~TRINITY_DN77421_c0_g1_i1.p1  ORF type:complete len:516 (+),score=106.01 TRINITY_DN77421_c0_g1_i1:29-1549(+)